jgi:hypothetical protein
LLLLLVRQAVEVVLLLLMGRTLLLLLLQRTLLLLLLLERSLLLALGLTLALGLGLLLLLLLLLRLQHFRTEERAKRAVLVLLLLRLGLGLLLRHLLTRLRLTLGQTLGLALDEMLLRTRALRTLGHLTRRHGAMGQLLRKLLRKAHLGRRDLLLQSLLAGAVGRLGHAVGQHRAGELGEALVLVQTVGALKDAVTLLGGALLRTALLEASLLWGEGRTWRNGGAVGHGAGNLGRLALNGRALLRLRHKLVRRWPPELHARAHRTTGRRTAEAGVGRVGVLVADTTAVAQGTGRGVTRRVLRATRWRALRVVGTATAAVAAACAVLGTATSPDATDAATEAAKELLGALHFLFGARDLASGVVGGWDLLVVERKGHRLLGGAGELLIGLVITLELLLLL